MLATAGQDGLVRVWLVLISKLLFNECLFLNYLIKNFHIFYSFCSELYTTIHKNIFRVLKSQLNYFTSLRERYGQEAGDMDYSTMHHFGDMRSELYEYVEEDGRMSATIGTIPEQPEEVQQPTFNASANKASIKHKKGSISTRPQSSSSSFASSTRSRPQSASTTHVQTNGQSTLTNGIF